MDKDTWGLIDDRIKSMHGRNERMDKIADLLYWDDSPYKLVKPDGKTELRDAISITPNLPKVFVHGVVSDLMGGKWQTVIEGKISGRQSHIVEQFVDDGLAQADERLSDEYGIASLFGWMSNHVCIRWAIGARLVSQVIDNEYRIDCLPVDMRWTPYVSGKWVAPITYPSKYDLEEELEKHEKVSKDNKREYNKPSINTDTDNEVRDYWDKKKHEYWVNKKLVYSQANTLGYAPFVIVVPSSGFMLRDKGYLKHEGEDLLFLNAGLYEEFARSVSLEQTSGYAGLYPAYEYETKGMDGSPPNPVPQIDQTLKVIEGERHLPVPRGDINRAGQTARVDIQEMIGNGAPLSPRQYNTPPSAILLAGETEMISRLQNARKDALGIFRSRFARMMIEQFIQVNEGGVEFLIGKKGKRTTYSSSKLGNPDEYNISYHLSVKNKRQELANLAEFSSVYDKLPLTWTLPNILMADDPDGIINDLELQRAKSINPAISLLEMAVKYAREANETEDEGDKELKIEQSRILTHEYVMTMRLRTQPPQIEEPKGNSQLLNSIAGGAMGGEEGQVRQPAEVIQ